MNKTIDFGPWTSEEMADLLRLIIDELDLSIVMEVLKEKDIID